ncbi:MAG: VWA domain-containing protein [Acidobacteriaceae bacterium]
MHAIPQLLCTSFILGMAAVARAPVAAQTTQVTPSQSETQREENDRVRPSGVTLTVATQLVQVDVVVQDSKGNAVQGLKLSDFQVAEDKKTQTIKNFEEHVSVDPIQTKVALPLQLGPGMFSDYTPVPANEALTVILLDRLNTPMTGQTYVLRQLRNFLRKVDPGTRVAIFGLTSRLIMLQGFTDDPKVLLAALDHKISAQSSVLLPHDSMESLSQAEQDAGAPPNPMLEQFEADMIRYQTQSRVGYTLKAFDELASYLSSFPGRKNVLWLSGSFPLNINSFSVADNDFSDQFKEAANLLASARVAIYPVDANGLEIVNQSLDSSQGFDHSPSTDQIADTATAAAQNQAHNTMDQLATDTGGKAFYNINDLVSAFTQTVKSGSDYYTLTYSPSNHGDRAGYRSIHVQLMGEAGSRGLRIAYRRGYYQEDSHHDALVAEKTAATAPVDLYAAALMQHGAPAPSEILFKIRVQASAPGTEDSSNAHRTRLNLSGSSQRYRIDFATLATKIDMPVMSDGNHHGAVEFVTFVYNGGGKLLITQHQTVHFNLTPEDYAQMLKGGIGYTQEVSAPTGAQSFRIAVHDLASGRLGVVEVPLSAVSHLVPAA